MRQTIAGTILLFFSSSCGYFAGSDNILMESSQVRNDVAQLVKTGENEDSQNEPPAVAVNTLVIVSHPVNNTTLVNDVFEKALNIRSESGSAHQTFFIEFNEENRQGQVADTFVIEYPVRQDGLNLLFTIEGTEIVVCYHTMNQFNNSSLGCIPRKELVVSEENSLKKIELEYKGEGFYEVLTLLKETTILQETSRRVSILPFAYENISSIELLSEKHMASEILKGENPFVKEIRENTVSIEPIIKESSDRNVKFDQRRSVDIEQTIEKFTGIEASPHSDPVIPKVTEPAPAPSEPAPESREAQITTDTQPAQAPDSNNNSDSASESESESESGNPFANCESTDFECHNQIVMTLCAQNQSVTNTFEISMPTSSSCDFNADGNSSKSLKASARAHHKGTLTLPTNAIVCNFEKIYSEDQLLFNDEMFVLANNLVLTASMSHYLDPMPKNNADLIKFSWESMVDTVENESAPIYCLGTSCTLPPERTFGQFSLGAIGEIYSQQIFSEGLIQGMTNSVSFSGVAIGDDDSDDCRLQQRNIDNELQNELKFKVIVNYVTAP